MVDSNHNIDVLFSLSIIHSNDILYSLVQQDSDAMAGAIAVAVPSGCLL